MGVSAPSSADERTFATLPDFISEGGREFWYVRWAGATRLPGGWVFLALTLVLAGITRLISALDPSTDGLDVLLGR
jgi:hypothetical protein